MHANWTRLTREEAHAVLNKLGSQRDPVVFSKEATEVAWRQLPFYTHNKIYRLTNFATMPTFTMSYLSDGTNFSQLDGTANPIYAVNEKDPIRLNEMNVTPYLDFFFSNVQGSEGDVFLIKDPKTMPFLDSMTSEQRQTVASSFKPLKVAHDAETGIHKISGTLYYGGGLISSMIHVTTQGRLSFQEQHLLLSGIYFPADPYNRQWAEG